MRVMVEKSIRMPTESNHFNSFINKRHAYLNEWLTEYKNRIGHARKKINKHHQFEQEVLRKERERFNNEVQGTPYGRFLFEVEDEYDGDITKGCPEIFNKHFSKIKKGDRLKALNLIAKDSAIRLAYAYLDKMENKLGPRSSEAQRNLK